MKYVLPFLLLCMLPCLLHAQTVGQYEIRKRGTTGFTNYGVTLANGEVIGQTAGVPAAIAPQPLSGTLTTLSSATAAGLALMDDADAAAQRTTLGLGAAALLGASTGGNATTDSGKVVIFGTDGSLQATGIFNLYNSSGALAAQLTPSALALSTGTSFFAILRAPANSTMYDLYLPTTPGNLIGTGDTATVTNTMLAGSIDLTTKVTGALPVANGGTAATTAAAARVSLLPSMTGNAGKVLAVNGGETDYELATISAGLTINTTTTSGASAGDLLTSDGSLLQKLTPGTGVSTWLATPTLANLNSAVSDADVAITAANTFSAAQTISLSALGTTPAGGLILINPTAATSGNQQNSPVLQLTGEGYTTGGGSVTHNWYATVKPTQYTGTLPVPGGLTDLGYLHISGDIDGSMNNVRSGYSGYNDLKLDLHGTLWLNAYTGRDLALGGTPAAGSASMALDHASGLFLSQSHRVGWVTGFNAFGATDFELARLTTNTLALTDYTTGGMMLDIMLTHTSATSYEAVEIGWTGSVAHLWTAKGSGGGTARDLVLGFDSAEKLRINAGGVTIGASGSAIPAILRASATKDFDLTTDIVDDETITCTGAVSGDEVVVGVPAGSVTATSQFFGWVSADDTVTIRCRTAVAGENPSSGTFSVSVIKR